MNKQWYINVDGKNKGPFSTEEFIDLYETNVIGDFTLCWEKDFDEWTPYFKLNFESFNIDLPPLPSLPPLPQEDELPALPIEVDSSPVFYVEEGDTNDIGEEIQYSDETSKSESSFPVYSFAASVVCTLCFIIFTYLILIPSSKRSIIFKNVSIDTLRYLEGKIDKDKFYIKFGLDKSGEVIFGRSNLSKEANVRVLFEYIAEDQSTDKISFTSSAVIKDGDIKFDDFEFLNGDKIEQGKYKVRASAVIYDSLQRLKNFTLGRVGEFEFEEEVYLIPSTLEEYKKNLSKIKLNTTLIQEELLLALEQKAQTIDSILTAMALHYRLSINLNFGKNSSVEFEKRYHSQSGPLLQSIILEDYEKLYAKSEQKLILQELGASLHNVAKDVAALSSELSEDLKKIKKMTPALRVSKREMLSTKVEEMKQKIEEIKNNIETEIAENKNSK